jgi:hypothetical protein
VKTDTTGIQPDKMSCHILKEKRARREVCKCVLQHTQQLRYSLNYTHQYQPPSPFSRVISSRQVIYLNIYNIIYTQSGIFFVIKLLT